MKARLGKVGRPLNAMPRGSCWALADQGREVDDSVVPREASRPWGEAKS